MKRFHSSRFLKALSAIALLAVLFPVAASAQSSGVTETYSGLEPLGDGFVYEGWLIIDGDPVSTGLFSVNADGDVERISTPNIPNAADASTFVLTIEPSPDPDPAPADTHVLAGDFVNGVATLSIEHPAALGTDFSSATGSYAVTTPSTTTEDDDYSGIWFLEVTDDGPAASLDLPTLPAGWAYEGWTVGPTGPLSTGTFLSGSGADDSSVFSGPEATPPFPGEDFVANAPDGLEFPRDLSGYPVVISVEPSPDDSPAPFALKPLVGEVPNPVVTGAAVSNPLAFAADSLSGTVTVPGGSPQLALTGATTDAIFVFGVILVAFGAVAIRSQRRLEHQR